jgi:membrane protease YdiL (CAAX protease family)
MELERNQPYRGLSYFLIAVGIVIVNVFIFNQFSQWICVRLFDVDIMPLMQDRLFETLKQNEINALKFSQAFTSFGGFIMSSLVIIQVFREKPIAFMKLDKAPKLMHWLLGFVLFFALMPVVQQLLAWNEWFKPADSTSAFMQMVENIDKQNNRMYELLLLNNTGWSAMLNLLVMALLPAIGEEFFFRGILFRVFSDWTKKQHLAVWLTALLFTGMHFQFFKLLPMLLLAASFGYLMYFSGSLWLSIVLHFVNNAIVVVSDAMIKSGYQNNFLKEDFVFPIAAVLIGLSIAAFSFYRLQKTRII